MAEVRCGGQKAKCSLRADVFRFGPNNGHRSIGSACPFGAISGLMRCSKLRLLVDHLVCAGEPRRGKIEAEHSSGLEVDDQLVFGRRLQYEHFKQP